MLLQMGKGSIIENPRAYAAPVVESLQGLLAEGGEVQPDPNRDHFYQLKDGKHAYYIHVSPVTGNIILLAKWSCQSQTRYADAGSLVA